MVHNFYYFSPCSDVLCTQPSSFLNSDKKKIPHCFWWLLKIIKHILRTHKHLLLPVFLCITHTHTLGMEYIKRMWIDKEQRSIENAFRLIKLTFLWETETSSTLAKPLHLSSFFFFFLFSYYRTKIDSSCIIVTWDILTQRQKRKQVWCSSENEKSEDLAD